MEEYNRNNPNAQVDLKHLSHSLGVSSTKNAMNWASYKGMKFDNTTFKADTIGTSYPMTNNTLGGRLSFGLYDQGYTEKASGLFRDGKVEYAVAPRDIVGTGVQLPWVPGAFSLGIGNTNTTGSNTTGIPLWGILVGDHTKAYFKDETVIKFITPDDDKYDQIINYQQKTWGQIGPKTEVIYFRNKEVMKENKEVKDE